MGGLVSGVAQAAADLADVANDKIEDQINALTDMVNETSTVTDTTADQEGLNPGTTLKISSHIQQLSDASTVGAKGAKSESDTVKGIVNSM